MKKLENNVKPLIYDKSEPNEQELENVKSYYNQQLIQEPLLAMHIYSLTNEGQRQA